MTNKEAVTVLKMVEAHDPICKEAKDMASEALEKQVPKKFKKMNGKVFTYIKCRVCGNILNYGQNYCEDCGHAIDWSEYDE